MSQLFSTEKWEPVIFNFEYTVTNRIEVSNFGRVRTFNKISAGNLLHPSITNGYQIVRLKFWAPQNSAAAKRFALLLKEIKKLEAQVAALNENTHSQQKLDETYKLLLIVKKNYRKQVLDEKRKRIIYFQSPVHRLVATYFLSQPSETHSIVSHLDYNKLNNTATNLQWMTPKENQLQQQKSPLVLKERKLRQEGSSAAHNKKLSITRVMLLKKMLNNDKPMAQLVKLFKITSTQIMRIKRGENWGSIPAAH